MLGNELAETLSLDGLWDFQLADDPAWKTIQVPGCWEAQQNSRFLEGPANYWRKIVIPESWQGKHIQLEFDAASYASTISLNNASIGEHRGLWTPFSFDITQAVIYGQINDIEVILYKPGTLYPMRSCLAGFIPDISTTFGGLWQSVRLRAMRAGLKELLLDPDPRTGSLRVRTHAILWETLTHLSWQVSITMEGQNISSQVVPYLEDGTLDLKLRIPNFNEWSTTTPALYTILVTLFNGDEPIAQVTGRTGFRNFSARGNQLLLNGHPFMVRGILSWGWEPDRIAPFYTREQAQEEISRIQQMGFNLIKLCLFVPNQAYFEVADEMGMLLWEEWPMWLPEVTPELRRLAPDEYAQLTDLTRHHPSVVLYSLGCELNRSVDSDLLKNLDKTVRELVSDVLVCDNSGSGESYGGLDFDYSDFTDYHPYYDLHYFEPLLDNWRRDWQKPRPWIFGEFCDSDTFRDQEQIIQANNGIRPWWLTKENPVTTWRPESKAMLEAQERLAKVQLPFTPQEITRVSYAQSQVIRKYTLETLRRRVGMGGYIITGLRDTPISTSGIWDDFNRPKWTRDEFIQVNDEAVICLDVGRRRQWRFGGDRPDRLDLYNFRSEERPNWHVIFHTTGFVFPIGSHLSWSLSDIRGNTLSSGRWNTTHRIRPGIPGEVGVISCQLPKVDQPIELLLKITLEWGKKSVTNQWPVWTFPALHSPPAGLGILDPTYILDDCGEWLQSVPRLGSGEEAPDYPTLLTTVWNDAIKRNLMSGGRVLLLQQSGLPLPAHRCPFWREAIKLFFDHTFWAKFPHQGFTDMQFFGLASDVAFESYRFPELLPGLEDIRPVLRRLDARELTINDYLVEARISNGVLMACSLRLQGGAGAQPFGWQRNVAGSYMLQALLDYLFMV